MQERIKTGEKNIWSPLSRSNFKLLKSQLKTLKGLVSCRELELREDKGLTTSMFLASPSRPDLDSRKALSEYEFSIIPKALFISHGDLRRFAKSVLMNNLASISAASPTVRSPNAVVIFDAIAEDQRFTSSTKRRQWSWICQLFHELHQIQVC